MKSETVTKSSADWQSTKFQHLFRYVPSGTMFARFKIRGKQLKRSLGTTTLELAKRKLDDLKQPGPRGG